MTPIIRFVLAVMMLGNAQPSISAIDEDLSASNGQCVILLHGLARTNRSMSKMEKALTNAGYRVANIDYPSRQKRIETLAHSAITRGLDQCDQSGADQIHFVTHSLGGILVRVYLSQQALPRLGRVVMLAPPNQGSEVVDGWRMVRGFSWLNGPAGDQLGTDINGITRQLGPVDYPVGIVAGTRSINLILSLWLPNPDDGKVSVESTKVDGMTDFMTAPVAHPFIMRNGPVIEQVIQFLRAGKFDHLAKDRALREAATEKLCTQAAELSHC